MLRTVMLAAASLVFAGTAMADCGASHAAKRTITDDQAQAAQPAVKTATTAPAAKTKQAASESNSGAKSKQATRSTVALARDSAPQADKPTN